MIQVSNLTKQYGDHTAVDHLSFTMESGQIHGFLGPNGAGKSTTMNIITGCLSATDGSVTVCGKDIFKSPVEAKRHMGYLPEIPPLYLDMTTLEYLAFVAEAKGVEHELAYRQVKEAMELTQISDVADRLIKTLSKGYKQRVGIAQALLGSPDVIILDEPTVGLDPKQITEIRSLIRKLGETRTVIISSHILAEISELCDHVIIISNGKIVADDTIEALEASINNHGKLSLTAKCSVDIMADILETIPSLESYREEHTQDGYTRFVVEFSPKNDPSEEIFFAFADKRIAITDMSHEHLTLEDIFLRLTEEGAVDDRSADTTDYTPMFGNEEENNAEEAEE